MSTLVVSLGLLERGNVDALFAPTCACTVMAHSANKIEVIVENGRLVQVHPRHRLVPENAEWAQ